MPGYFSTSVIPGPYDLLRSSDRCGQWKRKNETVSAKKCYGLSERYKIGQIVDFDKLHHFLYDYQCGVWTCRVLIDP
jgi:hypothetical protein